MCIYALAPNFGTFYESITAKLRQQLVISKT
jgi:hypothetical protein